MTDPPLPEQARREVADARTMRGLTHPVRLALLEALGLEGQLTATQAAEIIGESPTTCSFHLRQLAKYGFVEEAGGGKGRTRPWRMTADGVSISSAGSDPATRVAHRALSRLFHERWFARLQEWLDARSSYPVAWQAAAESSETVIHLTAPELVEINAELQRVLARHRERLTDPARRPPDSVPVEFLTFSYPLHLPDDAIS
jgi:predicted ArsR family transcriptional regulator